MQMSASVSIGGYLIQRLRELGVGHVFGVPGDFILKFYDMLAHSDLQIVNTCDEQGAGFAADAYARLRGLGVVCVTWGVGGLKVVNTTAQAYAERSPVVVISGGPGLEERQKRKLLHHRVRRFDTQKKIFEQVTAASTVLDNPYTALQEIDRVLEAVAQDKRPVYIELPRDMVSADATRYRAPPRRRHDSDPESLRHGLQDAVSTINAAKRPVMLVDVEIHRFGLLDEVTQLAGKTGIPVAATLLGKSAIDEREPFYLGVYQGAIGSPEVRERVESSDCVLMLGTVITDINLGIYTAQLDQARCIHAASEKLSVGYRVYENVRLSDFIRGLIASGIVRRDLPKIPRRERAVSDEWDGKERITVEWLFDRLDAYVTDNTIVIADPGDALFAAENLQTHSCDFLSPAYYTSMGFAVPGAIGAQLADPKLRPLVLVGDGAFQMTGMELSTAVRFGLNPTVIVLNNGGYVTERYQLDGPFNDILRWDYSRLPEVLGSGRGFVVETREQLDQALNDAARYTESFCLLDVRLDPLDASRALRRLATGLAKVGKLPSGG